MKYVNIPKYTLGFQSVTSTQLIIPDYDSITAMFTISNGNLDDIIYVDNISLVIQ